MTTPIRLAVLLSGSGTTLRNLLDQIDQGQLNARVVLVLSSRSGVQGLERARDAGVPASVVDRSKYASTQEFSDRLFAKVRASRADLVCLAGFLRQISVPDDFQQRILNIHPSLIPAFSGRGFYGHRVHEAAITAGVKVSGCTVHFVDNEYDHGPIILQRTIAVLDDDTPDSLAQRVFAEECVAYPEAIRLYQANRLSVTGRHVRILNPSA